MIRMRQLREDELPRYLEIQEQEWDETMATSIEKLRSRFEVFPEGLLAAVDGDGSVVGCATLLLINGYDVEDQGSWEQITDNGWCTTHDPEGDIVFGVDVSIARGAPRVTLYMGYLEAIRVCLAHGASGVLWGSRMPRYHRYVDSMSPQEYIETKSSKGRYLDPEVELYSRLPGIKVLGVVEDYFKDWESMNCGVMLFWSNPLHGRRVPKPLQRIVVDRLTRRSRR